MKITMYTINENQHVNYVAVNGFLYFIEYEEGQALKRASDEEAVTTVTTLLMTQKLPASCVYTDEAHMLSVKDARVLRKVEV